MRFLELKVPPVIVVLITAALMWLVARLAPGLWFALPANEIIAAVLVAAGIGIAIAGVLSFRRAKTTVNPTTPNATSALVDHGIYSLTRNPMYLGMLLVLIGWGVYLSNLGALLTAEVFILYMNRFQIAPEERALGEHFGEEFASYRSRVRRWL